MISVPLTPDKALLASKYEPNWIKAYLNSREGGGEEEREETMKRGGEGGGGERVGRKGRRGEGAGRGEGRGGEGRGGEGRGGEGRGGEGRGGEGRGGEGRGGEGRGGEEGRRGGKGMGGEGKGGEGGGEKKLTGTEGRRERERGRERGRALISMDTAHKESLPSHIAIFFLGNIHSKYRPKFLKHFLDIFLTALKIEVAYYQARFLERFYRYFLVLMR